MAHRVTLHRAPARNGPFQRLAYWFFLPDSFQKFTGWIVLLRKIAKEHPSRECGNIPKEKKEKPLTLCLEDWQPSLSRQDKGKVTEKQPDVQQRPTVVLPHPAGGHGYLQRQ